MSEVLSLFDALSSGLLSSCGPAIDERFSLYEAHLTSADGGEEEIDHFLQKILIKFPSDNSYYNNIISTLTKIAGSSPDAIVNHLTSKFKTESNLTLDSMDPSFISVQSLTFKASNYYHFQFVHYLSLIILSDLIYSIYAEYPSAEPIHRLVSCGYSVCMMEQKYPKLQHAILEKWSFIFAVISKISISDISLSFEQYIDDTNIGLVYWLVSRVSGSQSFVDIILSSLHQSRKRKTTNSMMLSALAVFLSFVPCSESVLDEFFSIAWSLRSTSGLKDGVIELISALFNRLPQHSRKIAAFFSSRVYKHAGKDEKVERSAKAFMYLIRGNVSSVQFVKKWSNLNCVMCSGTKATNQNAQDSFASVFMKVFFQKSNFALCLDLFSDIIVHLAALDISYFEKEMIPCFIKLKPSDPRFIALLNAVGIMNNPLFLETAYCKPKIAQLKSINSFIRSVLLNLIPYLERYASGDEVVLLRDSAQLLPVINEADNIVSHFLSVNSYRNFEAHFGDIHSRQTVNTDISFAKYALQCMSYSATVDDLSDGQIPQLLLRLAVSRDREISSVARQVFHSLADNNFEMLQIFMIQAVRMIRTVKSNEIRCHCLVTLLDSVDVSMYKNIGEELLKDMESAALFAFLSESPYCRTLALRLIKHLSAIGAGKLFKTLQEQSESISEAVNRSMLILNVPEKPSMITPPLDSIDFMHACSSRYNTLWILFLAEIMNVLIENDEKEILEKVKHFVEPHAEKMPTSDVSDFTHLAVDVVYLNSLVDNVNTGEHGDDVREMASDEAQGKVTSYIDKIMKGSSENTKKLLIHTFCFLNWRLIPCVLNCLLSIDREMFPHAACAWCAIIQNPENFNHIISTIFRQFVEFLSMMQSYFIHLKINSTRDIKWDEQSCKLLREHEDICINYCILISAAFNNIQEQIPEDEWPVSYRQILVQFLMHWTDLPPEFQKLQAYAINALLPIIHAGTVFTDGFAFDVRMLEMLLQCQLSGYPVLDCLLLFHLDILLDEFIKSSIIRPKREAVIFFDAILSALQYCDDASVLQSHVGALIMLCLYLGVERLKQLNEILLKIAELFLDTTDEFGVDMIENAEDLDYVPTMFQFATEQVIDASLEIIRISSKATVTKTVVTFLGPWFERIRILPTHSVITQGVPSKYRIYTVMSFIDSMLSISMSLSEENQEVFSKLWHDLIQSSDNSVVMLLAESENVKDKQAIFSQLLGLEPRIISKYIEKRLSFAYWYFLRSERNEDVDSIHWMVKVMTQAFTDYVESSAQSFTVAMHFSLLFIEDCKELFEALIAVFGIEVVDSAFVWTQEGVLGTIRASAIVEELASMLREKHTGAIEKWTTEATRWVVGCCDIKLAYRSLVILNALNGSISANFAPLLCEAVAYHLSRTTDDECDEVSAFVGECMDILYTPISSGDLASFGFQFASAFLGCPVFSKAIQKAMPIFMYYVDHPALKGSAKGTLVDAFVSFLPKLETDTETQKLLLSIIDLTDAPPLQIVLAAFLKKPLPFTDTDKTYQEIMTAPIASFDAEKAIKLFHSILPSASKSLIDSIITICTDLLGRFKHSIDRYTMFPIYRVAIQNVSSLTSAIDFMTLLLKLDPGISLITYDKSADKKLLADVRKEIAALTTTKVEIAPITNCKQISQLHGMISQTSPPKIYPFATQYDMYQRLRNDTTAKSRGRRATKRWSSSMSMTSGIISNKSMYLPSNQTGNDFGSMELDALQAKPVILSKLDLPEMKSVNTNFIISPEEFMNLTQ